MAENRCIRKAEICRETGETNIKLSLGILPKNSKGSFEGTSGVGFFDHMLCAMATHGGFNIKLSMIGDLNVDCHHSVEDVGIVLGLALEKAMGDKKGIARFCDNHIPMDEALCFCAIDVSGRPFLVFDSEFNGETINTYDTQMTEEFFRAVAFNSKITVHLRKIYGKNDHHVTEALFKAFGKALGKALQIENDQIMSSKGTI